jgi:hypothetical protein
MDGKGPEERQPRRLSRTSDDTTEGEPGERRSQAERNGNRELARLERNLDDSADRCREDPQACARSLQRSGGEMARAAREAQKASPRRALADALNQLRQRVSREGQESESQQSLERGYEEAARGESAPSGTTADAANRGAAAATATVMGVAEIGTESGGSPLGSRTASSGLGQAVEAKVASTAGPSRSQIIESGASQGFAERSYHGLYRDYSAAVEETLDTTAVPAGRRYLVRRYFQLIRPR